MALVVSWLGYILMIPDNWYGGAGTIGNRYFVNLVPLGLLLLPRGRAAWAAVGAAVLGGALLFPVLASPVHHSLRPGEHATRAAFRRLPPEITMLGDLSVFTDVWRKRRPFNAPGGDPGRRPPGAPPPYFLWFLDDATLGQESSFGAEGFWLRGGESGDVVLQALAPPPTDPARRDRRARGRHRHGATREGPEAARPAAAQDAGARVRGAARRRSGTTGRSSSRFASARGTGGDGHGQAGARVVRDGAAGLSS